MDINKPLRAFDRWQQGRRLSGFMLAVVKKYGDDNGGYMAALLTYYAFLSLFPLLLVLVTVLQLWFQDDAVLRSEVSTSVGHFFPLLGAHLQTQIHGLSKTGIGLAVGVVITLYGARGAADAFRYALDNMWQVPKRKRVGFPRNLLHSVAIMAAATGGFGATIAVSAFSTELGHIWWAKALANLAGAIILMGVIGYSYRIAVAGRLPLSRVLRGAALAAVLIQLLLTFGSILLRHELQRLDSLYGTFAVVLGLLFWIYLIAQVVLFATEIDAVRHFRLWPRSTSGQLGTEADERALELHAQTEQLTPVKLSGRS